MSGTRDLLRSAVCIRSWAGDCLVGFSSSLPLPRNGRGSRSGACALTAHQVLLRVP